LDVKNPGRDGYIGTDDNSTPIPMDIDEKTMRPGDPIFQKALPPGADGTDPQCLFRVLLNKAEEAAGGVYFSYNEMNNLKDIAQLKGLMDNMYWVSDANQIMEYAFRKLELKFNPYMDTNPEGARSTIIEQRRVVNKVGMLRPDLAKRADIRTELHFQSGDIFGRLRFDPWGTDLSGRYFSGLRSVRYVHY
jgi:hypothetical protein